LVEGINQGISKWLSHLLLGLQRNGW